MEPRQRLARADYLFAFAQQCYPAQLDRSTEVERESVESRYKLLVMKLPDAWVWLLPGQVEPPEAILVRRRSLWFDQKSE
jgi:hypothetical protein